MLEDIKKEGNKAIEKTQKRIAKELKSKKFISLDNYVIEKIKSSVVNLIKNDIVLTPPPPHISADMSFSLFEVAKELKQDPKKLAEESATAINGQLGHSMSKLIESAETAGPYVNLFLNKNKVYQLIISQTIKLNLKFGQSDSNAKKVALIDYSGPNIAKPFGVGHLRSTVIGQALVNIYEATGYSVVKDNHFGDWGTQFGKLIYAYKMWADKKKMKGDPIGELASLYVKFHQEAEKNPDLEEKAREILQKLEKGDEKLFKLWAKFKKISISEFNRIYKKLGIKFDICLGESFFVEESEKLIKEILNRKIAFEDSESGAIAVENLEGLPSFLLRKKDGSTLYITRDLAALKFRKETFRPEQILYVVGEEQSLHFKQLFALANVLGYTNQTKVKHAEFGLVFIGGEKMSTRQGAFIALEELINQSIAKSKEILLEKNKGITSKELKEISKIVGIGAVVYNDLRQSRQKNISFDWKRMLDFEGGSAVYLQYTVARINSILKKLGADKRKTKISKPVFEKESEFALARKIMFFPLVILEAQKHDSPHFIATYLEELAQLFNHFYNEISIISTEDRKLRLSRITLIKSVATVIKNGLALLNIKTAKKI